MKTLRHHFKVGLREDLALDMVVELHPSAYDGQSPEDETQRIARDMLVRFVRDQWQWEDEGMEISEVIVAQA